MKCFDSNIFFQELRQGTLFVILSDSEESHALGIEILRFTQDDKDKQVMTVFAYNLLFYERYQPAKSCFTHIELEWETTDPQAHIKHFVDHAARVLDMEDSMRE